MNTKTTSPDTQTTVRCRIHFLAQSQIPRLQRLGLLSLLAVAGGFNCQCAFGSSATSPLSEIEPGPIAITSAPEPAAFSFDQPSGKAGSGSESAANAVSAVWNTPRLGNSQIEAGVGVVEFALTPFVAGYAAVKGAHQKLPAEKLSEAEGDLRAAMTGMANQEVFREMVMEAARAATHRILSEPARAGAGSDLKRACSGIIETHVKALRLVRSRHSDKTFKLCIKAQIRLRRSSDGATVYDQPVDYESGEGLFVDWTRQDGFASVARTGYHALAQEITGKLFSVPSDPPIWVGALPSSIANPHLFSPLEPRVAPGKAVGGLLSHPGIIPVADFHYSDNHSLEVLPEVSPHDLRIQGLVEAPDPRSGTETDTEYALDGLENHPNFVVQAAACFGAIPMGLWEHTIGALHATSDEAWQAADAIVQARSRQLPPETVVGQEIARCLAARSRQMVWCSTTGSIKGDGRSNLGSRGPLGVVQNHLPSPLPDSRLEVRLVNLALAGKPGKNPRLGLLLEVRTTLVRTCDGQELYAWPVCYRSKSRRLTDWAVKNASLFEAELRESCSQIATSMAEELVAKGFVPASVGGASTIASN